MPLRLVKFLKIGAMKATLYLMAQQKFCPYFLDVLADLVTFGIENIHKI
jgi:hypothetical protein